METAESDICYLKTFPIPQSARQPHTKSCSSFTFQKANNFFIQHETSITVFASILFLCFVSNSSDI